MNILLLGSGAREDALALRLSQSPSCTHLHAAPGNPGIERWATCHAIDPCDPAAVVALATAQAIDLVVIGPEAPLVAGVADAVRAAGIATFGPSAAAARLEGSKGFTKDLCARHRIPTAAYVRVETAAAGLAALDDFAIPVVIKADGLAAGKGVMVVSTEAEAREALELCIERAGFGDAGRVVVVEEGMSGPEVSLLAITDGTAVARFPAARDYKPIGEGNTGPNTGGMGSVSPVPDIPDALADELIDRVHRPVVAEMERRGVPFSGVLYAGLMMTADGPRVLEFNVRFGDPETQVVLPRLRSDLLDLLQRATRPGGLEGVELEWDERVAVTVVLASGGYPESSSSGDVIRGLDRVPPGVDVMHAGTAEADGEVVTAGGRVLNVTALGADVGAARDAAYAAADMIEFDGRQLRRDIALQAAGT